MGFESDFGAADTLDFNGFDVGLWDALPKAVLAALPDFLATAMRAFAAGVLTEAFGPPWAAFAVAVFRANVFEDVLEDVLEDPLEDFLRVFLDIRLPFVAFGGSTNRVLRVLSRAAGFAPVAGQV
jgi:hypothetical protein